MNATGCVPTNAEVRLRHLTHEQLVQIALIGMQNDKRLVEKVNRMLTREGELSRASVFDNADLLENVFKQMKLCENNACGVSMLWRHKWMDAHTVRWVRECVEMSNDERHLSICSRLQPSSTGSSAAMFPSRWGKICKEDAPLQYHNSHFFSPNFINHVSDMAFSSTSGSVYLCCQARIFVCTQPAGADQTALLEKEHELVEHVGDAEITQLLVDEAKGYLYVVVQDRIKDGDFVEILNLETLSGVATLVKPNDEKCIHSIALVQGNLWLCDPELDCITIYEWNDDTQTYKMPTIITPPSIFSAYRDYNWQHWHAPHFVCCAEVEDEARVFLVELEEYTNHEEEAITEWETTEDRSALLKYGSEKRHNTIGHRSSRIVVMDTGGRLIRNINIAALVPQAVLSRMPGSKFCSAAMVVSTEDKQIYLYATVRRTRQSFQDVNDAVTILKVAEASRGALCR
tara:strand:- start:2489 stop:3862 length:1374 start_codon:yes stop_codon:yes gene_type:complete